MFAAVTCMEHFICLEVLWQSQSTHLGLGRLNLRFLGPPPPPPPLPQGPHDGDLGGGDGGQPHGGGLGGQLSL